MKILKQLPNYWPIYKVADSMIEVSVELETGEKETYFVKHDKTFSNLFDIDFVDRFGDRDVKSADVTYGFEVINKEYFDFGYEEGYGYYIKIPYMRIPFFIKKFDGEPGISY